MHTTFIHYSCTPSYTNDMICNKDCFWKQHQPSIKVLKIKIHIHNVHVANILLCKDFTNFVISCIFSYAFFSIIKPKLLV
jgi:hypothetical protein